MAEREAASSANSVARAATKTLRDMLPYLMADSLPEDDALPHFIRMTGEIVAEQTADSTPEQITREMSEWIAAHPKEQRELELLVDESYRRRLEKCLIAVPIPMTDREADAAADAISNTLLTEHVPKRWVRDRMKEQRRRWAEEVRTDEKNWELLERSLPQKDVVFLRESIRGDEDTFRSRVAELTEAAEHLSDRVRHAIGVVAMHAEKRRLYETLTELARRAEPIREANDRGDALRHDVEVRDARIESTRNELERVREKQRSALEADRKRREAVKQTLYKPMGAAIAKREGMKRRADATPADKQASFQADFAAANAIADEYIRQYDKLDAPSASGYEADVERLTAALTALQEEQKIARQNLQETAVEAARLQTEKTAGIQEIAAALPPMSDRNRRHRAFLERLTFLGVQPSQDDWERFILSYGTATRNAV